MCAHGPTCIAQQNSKKHAHGRPRTHTHALTNTHTMGPVPPPPTETGNGFVRFPETGKRDDDPHLRRADPGSALRSEHFRKMTTKAL